MFRRAAAVVVLVALSSAASAQSFECAKASTPTEHLICSRPALGELDATMAGLYKEALDRNPGRVSEIRQIKVRGGDVGKHAATTQHASKRQRRTALPSLRQSFPLAMKRHPIRQRSCLVRLTGKPGKRGLMG